MNRSYSISPYLALVAFLVLTATLGMSGCGDKSAKTLPKVLQEIAESNRPSSSPEVNDEKSMLETELKSRLEETARADRGMMRQAEQMKDRLGPEFELKLEELKSQEANAAIRLQNLPKVEDGIWKNFKNDTRRHLNQLDWARESVESYLKERS